MDKKEGEGEWGGRRIEIEKLRDHHHKEEYPRSLKRKIVK